MRLEARDAKDYKLADKPFVKPLKRMEGMSIYLHRLMGVLHAMPPRHIATPAFLGALLNKNKDTIYSYVNKGVELGALIKYSFVDIDGRHLGYGYKPASYPAIFKKAKVANMGRRLRSRYIIARRIFNNDDYKQSGSANVEEYRKWLQEKSLESGLIHESGHTTLDEYSPSKEQKRKNREAKAKEKRSDQDKEDYTTTDTDCTTKTKIRTKRKKRTRRTKEEIEGSDIYFNGCEYTRIIAQKAYRTRREKRMQTYTYNIQPMPPTKVRAEDGLSETMDSSFRTLKSTNDNGGLSGDLRSLPSQKCLSRDILEGDAPPAEPEPLPRPWKKYTGERALTVCREELQNLCIAISAVSLDKPDPQNLSHAQARSVRYYAHNLRTLNVKVVRLLGVLIDAGRIAPMTFLDIARNHRRPFLDKENVRYLANRINGEIRELIAAFGNQNEHHRVHDRSLVGLEASKYHLSFPDITKEKFQEMLDNNSCDDMYNPVALRVAAYENGKAEWLDTPLNLFKYFSMDIGSRRWMMDLFNTDKAKFKAIFGLDMIYNTEQEIIHIERVRALYTLGRLGVSVWDVDKYIESLGGGKVDLDTDFARKTIPILNTPELHGESLRSKLPRKLFADVAA